MDRFREDNAQLVEFLWTSERREIMREKEAEIALEKQLDDLSGQYRKEIETYGEGSANRKHFQTYVR